jgi:hypothetical protein
MGARFANQKTVAADLDFSADIPWVRLKTRAVVDWKLLPKHKYPQTTQRDQITAHFCQVTACNSSMLRLLCYGNIFPSYSLGLLARPLYFVSSRDIYLWTAAIRYAAASLNPQRVTQLAVHLWCMGRPRHRRRCSPLLLRLIASLRCYIQ